MRKPIALVLAAAVGAAGCASDPPESRATEAAGVEPPAGRGSVAPAVAIALLVGAGIVILLISNSGIPASKP